MLKLVSQSALLAAAAPALLRMVSRAAGSVATSAGPRTEEAPRQIEEVPYA